MPTGPDEEGTRLRIRPEQAGDAPAIAAVIAAAFAGHPYSKGEEGPIVLRLRAAGALTISLVAEAAGEVVGHIAFSPVTVAGREVGWYGLGPLAVLPARQRAGIGTGLVLAGLARLRAIGAKGCVLLGSPAYYGRFGFAPARGLVLEGAPADHFQALALGGPLPQGRVEFHKAFEISTGSRS